MEAQTKQPRIEWYEEALDEEPKPRPLTTQPDPPLALPVTLEPQNPPKPAIPRTPRDYKPTPQGKGEIPIFNRTHGMLGLMERDYPYIELPAGRWTTTTTHGKPIPKDFIYRYLLNSPDISVQLPYKPLRGDKTKLTVAAPLVSVTGWGIASGYIVDGLAKLRLDWDEKIYRDYADAAQQSDLMLFPLANWHYQGMPELTRALMRKPHHPTEWTLALTIPSDLPAVPSPQIILYSMWEVGILPKEWRALMEQNHVRHLIVPSQSQVDLFRQGYDGDISVVPLGVDTNVFSFYERPQRSADEPFTILLYGLLGARKAPVDVLIEVCYRAFSGAYGEPIDNWRLIMKTRAGVLSGLQAVHDYHVQIINQDYFPNEMAELTHKADVAISLPHFEGYGLPFRESMSTGLPVIVAAHSGHLDDCRADLNIPISSDEEVPATEGYHNPTEGWRWFEPNWDQAARALRREYNDWVARGRTQSEMGRRASKYIAENRTWKQTATGIQNILERVIR